MLAIEWNVHVRNLNVVLSTNKATNTLLLAVKMIIIIYAIEWNVHISQMRINSQDINMQCALGVSKTNM